MVPEPARFNCVFGGIAFCGSLVCCNASLYDMLGGLLRGERGELEVCGGAAATARGEEEEPLEVVADALFALTLAIGSGGSF